MVIEEVGDAVGQHQLDGDGGERGQESGVDGRGPDAVVAGLFKPLMVEWSRFSLVPTEFIAEGGTVVSLGDFAGVHAITGKTARARYTHVWTVRDGRIASFRQYIDTLAIAQARV